MTPEQMRIVIAEELGIGIHTRKFKHENGTMLNVCPKCGSDKLKVSDCGYSSFNCGSVNCKCGEQLQLSNLSCFPNKEISTTWNKYCKVLELPNYPTDLNACHEMWKTLDTKELRIKFHYELNGVITRAGGHATSTMLDIDCCVENATAPQRCEAWIKTLCPERWVD